MISKLSLVIALFALGALPLWGQDSDAPSGKYFRAMGIGVTTEALHFSQKGKDKNISVSDTVPSILYHTSGTSKIPFYKIVEGADGKGTHVEVAHADTGTAGRLALLIFLPNPKTPDQYDVEVLPDDLSVFPLGAYRVINRSMLPLRVAIADKSADIGPFAVRVLSYQAPAGGGGAAVRAYTLVKHVPKLVYADTWNCERTYRTDILVSPREGSPKSVHIGRLRDNPTLILNKKYLPKD